MSDNKIDLTIDSLNDEKKIIVKKILIVLRGKELSIPQINAVLQKHQFKPEELGIVIPFLLKSKFEAEQQKNQQQKPVNHLLNKYKLFIEKFFKEELSDQVIYFALTVDARYQNGLFSKIFKEFPFYNPTFFNSNYDPATNNKSTIDFVNKIMNGILHQIEVVYLTPLKKLYGDIQLQRNIKTKPQTLDTDVKYNSINTIAKQHFIKSISEQPHPVSDVAITTANNLSVETGLPKILHASISFFLFYSTQKDVGTSLSKNEIDTIAECCHKLAEHLQHTYFEPDKNDENGRLTIKLSSQRTYVYLSKIFAFLSYIQGNSNRIINGLSKLLPPHLHLQLDKLQKSLR